MKLLLALLLALAASVTAWTADDHEIFRLRDEVANAEGAGVSFYEVLGIKPGATLAEITTAKKRRSLRLHPDKAIPALLAQRAAPPPTKKGDKKKPGVRVHKGPSEKERAQITKEANDRYARFVSVAKVLEGEGRERYDHFLHNGFPAWRGTGYYYARFRPGLGSVLVGLLVVFGGGAHYGAMYISWKRQRDFVQRYVSHARKMAWGNDAGLLGLDSVGGVATPPRQPPPEEEFGASLNRKQKRMQEKEGRKKDSGKAVKAARTNGISRPVDGEPLDGPQGSRKKVIAENGKVLIVDSVGSVFLEQETDGDVHEYLLDPDEIPRPTLAQTALVRLPVWVFNQTVGRAVDRLRGTSELAEQGFLDGDGRDLTLKVGGGDDAGGDALDTATSSSAHEEVRKRKSKQKKR